MKSTFSITLEGMNNPITGIVEGNPYGLSCLVLGPASIYIPTIPALLKKQFFFYGADYYWTYKDKISPKTIQTLTFDDMVHDGEKIRKAFEINGFPVSKTLILGPSALGWLALGQAKAFPDTILGVVGLNTPLVSMEALMKEQLHFISPYNPSLFPQLATEQSKQLWEKHQRFTLKYNHKSEVGFANDTDDYVAELKREEIRYMEDNNLFNEMLNRWKPFNITTRRRFFEEAQKVDPNMFKDIECPTWIALGVRDGIVPPYTISEDSIPYFPKNFDYYIFDSKHMPQLEDANSFTYQFNQWVGNNFNDHKKTAGLSKL